MTAYKKTMREALQEVSSFKVKKEEKENQSFIGPEPLPDFDDEGEEVNTTPHEVELDEAKMSSKQIAALKKAYEPMRGGRLSMDNATKLGNLMDRFDKDKDLLIQLFKADIPFVSKIAMTRLISKHKMKGAELNKLADKDEFYRKMYGESLDEDGDYKSKADAMAAAAASYAKQRDPLDEIEVYKMSGNKFEINHPMNSSGRDSIQKRGGKLIARVGKNYKEEAELDEAKQKPYVSSDRDGFHVMNGSGKIAKSFKDKKLAQAYFKKNYDKLMKEKLDKEDEPIVKAVVKMLKKASNAHAGQAKDLEKAVKEDSENEGFASDAQRRAAFASGYKEKGKKKDESAASDARRAMASDPSTKQKFSKNVSATDDDVKAADKNIIMQMRKAVSLRGNKVEFMDKKKVMIPQKIAQAVISKYNNMKKPADKEKFQSKISKSYKSMLTTLKERNEINNKNNSLDQLKELVKEMKGKNNG